MTLCQRRRRAQRGAQQHPDNPMGNLLLDPEEGWMGETDHFQAVEDTEASHKANA